MVIVKYPNQMCLSKIIEGKAKKKKVYYPWSLGFIGCKCRFVEKSNLHLYVSTGYNNYLQKPIIGIRKKSNTAIILFEEEY